jgi:heme oxygenase (biliverdin-IX-beta and delta-forming)
MFSDELKEVTLRAHTRLEKKLVTTIRNINKVDDYVRLLRLMYGYYKPLQDMLEPFIKENNIANHFTVRNVEDIRTDIQHLQPGADDDIPVCPDTPSVNTGASSLGALYVTEGSTLGGQIITKMISRQLNISPEKGFSFFRSYGDETPVMWERFKSILNHPRDEAQKTEMMKTAIETFSKFKDWIEDNERK